MHVKSQKIGFYNVYVILIFLFRVGLSYLSTYTIWDYAALGEVVLELINILK